MRFTISTTMIVARLYWQAPHNSDTTTPAATNTRVTSPCTPQMARNADVQGYVKALWSAIFLLHYAAYDIGCVRSHCNSLLMLLHNSQPRRVMSTSATGSITDSFTYFRQFPPLLQYSAMFMRHSNVAKQLAQNACFNNVASPR